MADDLTAASATAPPASWEVMLKRGIRKRCPRCGAGHLYDGYFRMKERCPGCGFKFEREQGFFVGSYLINFAITEGFLFVLMMVFIAVLSANADISPVPVLVVGFVLAVTTPAIFYPFARTIWSAIDLGMTPLELPEIIAAREHLAASGEGPAPERSEQDRPGSPPAEAEPRGDPSP